MASNSRTWPFTGATAWAEITDEARTVAEFDEFPGYYGFQLREKPNSSTPPVITEAVTGGQTFTVVNAAPNAGQVRINYETGICQFNITDDGVDCLCTYEGGGSPANLELLSEIATFLGRTTDDLDEGVVNKYFSGKDTDDLPEGTASKYLTAPNLADTIDTATAQATPNDAGKIGFWDSVAATLRQMTFTQLKAYLKTYFDTVYQALGGFDIDGLTEKTTPDYTADYLPIYSDSASANRKVLLENALPKYAKISDTKSNGTSGGAFTSGAWQTRDINTEDSDEYGIVSISANQFTLQAGTYIISAIAPAYAVEHHKIKLRNVTDSTDVILGINNRVSTSDSSSSFSFLSGRFTIASSKTFELQHRCSATYGTGYGLACSFGVSETYTTVELWKL